MTNMIIVIWKKAWPNSGNDYSRKIGKIGHVLVSAFNNNSNKYLFIAVMIDNVASKIGVNNQLLVQNIEVTDNVTLELTDILSGWCRRTRNRNGPIRERIAGSEKLYLALLD